jgi:apolipoprotein N-acyltransferase
MLFTYISMHDLILFFSYNTKFMLGSEDIWEQNAYTQSTTSSISYFFLFQLPSIILYWMYEIFHTFFVVTAQFVAFFAMVFWLFLFLYTFFVFEKIENYFKFKREQRKQLYSNLLELKK